MNTFHTLSCLVLVMLLFSAIPGHPPCTILEFPLLAELLKLFLKNLVSKLLLNFYSLSLLTWSSYTGKWKPSLGDILNQKTNPLSLEKRMVWGDLIEAFQYLKGAHKKAGGGLFTSAWSDRTRGNGFKLKENRFTLDLRKKFFTVQVVRHRTGCPEKL